MECLHRILWIGSYQSDEMFKKMLSKSIGQASGFASQKGIIKGIDAIIHKNTEMDTIGVDAYPPYPIYPQKKVKRQVWSRTGRSFDVSVGYLNLKYLNYFTKFLALRSEVHKWVKTRSGRESTTIFVYAPSVGGIKQALYLKKKIDAKVYVLIPDIPKFVNADAVKLIKTAKQISEKITKKLFEKVDGFILYSKYMADYYNLPNDKWIVMEGVFDPDEAFTVDVTETEHFEKTAPIKIMYNGAIHKLRGTPQLLEAFDAMRDRDYELWFTGAGHLDSLVHECAKKDPRIRHFGYLDSREEVLELQRKADILIHTREIGVPSSTYCFPSKLFEYLVSEKPVVSVKIPGIPDEYLKYLIPIDTLSAEDIKNGIMKAANMDMTERQRRGKEAKEFVLKNKNSFVQARKILNFANVECD